MFGSGSWFSEKNSSFYTAFDADIKCVFGGAGDDSIMDFADSAFEEADNLEITYIALEGLGSSLGIGNLFCNPWNYFFVVFYATAIEFLPYKLFDNPVYLKITITSNRGSEMRVKFERESVVSEGFFGIDCFLELGKEGFFNRWHIGKLREKLIRRAECLGSEWPGGYGNTIIRKEGADFGFARFGWCFMDAVEKGDFVLREKFPDLFICKNHTGLDEPVRGFAFAHDNFDGLFAGIEFYLGFLDFELDFSFSFAAGIDPGDEGIGTVDHVENILIGKGIL